MRKMAPTDSRWFCPTFERLENRLVLAPVIDAGDHVLLADTPDQQIEIYVSGPDATAGMDLRVQIADGGPEVGGAIAGPAMTNVDLTTGTIFAHNNYDGGDVLVTMPQILVATIIAETDTVAASGLLATITIDTTGFFPDDPHHPWSLNLSDTLDGPTRLLDNQSLPMPLPATILDGTITLNYRPVADAGGPYAVGEGDTVSLNGSNSSDPDASDTIVSYQWDLDDDGVFGETGDDARQGDEIGAFPVFSAAGLDGPASWPVRLQVVDNHGFVSEAFDTATVDISNAAPVVDAGPDQTVDEGQTVEFSGSFTDAGSGDTHTIEWDFGDGNTDSGTLTPSHVYSDNGSYTVTMTVTDDDNATTANTLVVTVGNAAPVVDAGADQTASEGQTVHFGGSFTDAGSGDTHTIEWDFGDGSTASGTLTPSHVYADNGSYTVTLTVTDDDSAATADTLVVTVENVAPVVDAGVDQTADEGQTVYFSGSFTDDGSGDTHTIEWDFGDGNTASGTLTPSHVYADKGNYTVTLTVTDDDDAATSDTLVVYVGNVPPVVDAGDDQTVDEGQTVHFDGSFTDAGINDTHTIEWDFGDGHTAAGTLTPSHVYADNGTYTVTLTVTDDENAAAADTLVVTVRNVTPEVNAGANQTADEGQTVYFDGSFTDAGSDDTHTIQWNFGDGGTAAGTLTPAHVYADNGSYTVSLTVTDDDNAATVDMLLVTVQNVAPVVQAGQDQADVRVGQTVQLDPATFTDVGTLDTHAADIDWGDGTQEAGAVNDAADTVSGSHVYGAAGTYTVTVTVVDIDGGQHADTFTVTVVPAEVVGRNLFYNDSYFDGNQAGANPLDDNAIAVDKTPLLPGQTATFDNYSNFGGGINGIMVDIDYLPIDGALDADDFRFRVGNDNQPGDWDPAPAPLSVSVREGAGVGGSDRVTIIWTDQAIERQWLEVSVLPTARTGLPEADVFYFGNAIGEAGDSTLDTKVNAADMLAARNNPRSLANPAPIDFDYDYNRDARVNATDILIARSNQTVWYSALELITVPVSKQAVESGPEPENADAPPVKVEWLCAVEQLSMETQPSKRGPGAEEVDDVLPVVDWL